VADDRTPETHSLSASPPPEPPPEERPASERLQKLLARAGLGSRRSCERLISDGHVTVDGRVATLGERADTSTQRIEVDGQPIDLPTGELTLVLNKPSGYVVSTSVEPGQHGVYELLPDAPPNLRYVGRLDSDTEGVLLFTTIGQLVHRLTHPRYEVDKVYETTVEGSPAPAQLDQLRNGVELEDGWSAPATVEVTAATGGDTVLKLIIHEGRKRQIRRMCKAIGHPVRRLRRIAFGPITLRNVAPGESRELAEEELAELFQLAQIEAATNTEAAR